MEERYTLEEITTFINKAYMNTNYTTFVREILQMERRENDVWQEEKWENFQDMCSGLLRFPKEYLARIMQVNSE